MLTIEIEQLKNDLEVKIGILSNKISSKEITDETALELLVLHRDYELNGTSVEELKLPYADVLLALDTDSTEPEPIEQKVFQTVMDFMHQLQIRAEETIYQTDRVQEHSLDFIADLFNIVKPNHDTIELRRGTRIQFAYTNYKGETATRRAVVLGLFYGSNEYHPEPQFLLAGYDLDKMAPRGFALKDMKGIQLYEQELK